MAYWEFLNATPTKKTSYFDMKNHVQLIEKNEAFSSDRWEVIRFIGPVFFLKILQIPVIKDGRFVRQKKNPEKFLQLPKQCMTFDYYERTFDVEKCPYLKYAKATSPVLKLAVLNLISDSALPEMKKKLMRKTISKYSLTDIIFLSKVVKDNEKFRFFSNLPEEEKVILSEFIDYFSEDAHSRELLGSIKGLANAANNSSNIHMFANAFFPSKVKLMPDERKKNYTNMSLRETYETEKKERLIGSYYFTYKQNADDDKSLLTPVKVIQFSHATQKLIKNLEELNTITKEDDTVETRPLEDDEFGVTLNVRLEKQGTGFSYTIAKGERRPLTEDEKKYMIWDLTKLKDTTSYAEAIAWLENCGYTKSESEIFESDFSPVPPSQIVEEPVAAKEGAEPASKEVMEKPVEGATSTPWGTTDNSSEDDLEDLEGLF